jgi:molybdate transport system permease protein
MMGGNIPGKTRVLSVAIYDHVEAGEYADAHRLAAAMVVFALVVLSTLYVVNRPHPQAGERGEGQPA